MHPYIVEKLAEAHRDELRRHARTGHRHAGSYTNVVVRAQPDGRRAIGRLFKRLSPQPRCTAVV